jgi:hypothetical protein
LGDTFDRTADGSIDFHVGVETFPAHRTMTRAGNSSPSYYAMKENTQIRLKVDGNWEGKTPEAISQKTTCLTKATNTDVNDLLFSDSEKLYWDDYGTGDPNNKTNTEKGVAVLGVAVDGLAEAPTIANDAEWENLSWDVATDGKDVLNSDIIVSNNLTKYTFAKRNDDAAKKMVFVHPLSKITFNLTAGGGFTKGTIGETTNKFEKDPILTLSNATTLADIENESNNYALTKGTVSIKNGTAVSDDTKAKVIAETTSTTDAAITVIKQAIVYPGTQLGADDNTVIAVLNADDNIYYIKAKEIHDAIKTKGGHTDNKTLAGYNYIINITVNKTGLLLTATVTNWENVNSEEVHPIINVNATVGDGVSKPSDENTFAFYRSEDIEKDYVKAASPKVMTDGTIDWTGTTTLYWTSHYQHYHFRGIYPEDASVKEDDTDKHQYVVVTNGDYDATSFPSNFVIGMPEIAKGTMCGNPDHEQKDMSIYGICAREAAINLNFRYMMSQVEVVLSTSAEGTHNHVDLSNVVVELVNVYNTGHILLKDRSAEVTGDVGNFPLPQVSTTDHKYLGVIVPQELTYTTAGASTNVRIKITVTNSDSTKDIYYADVNPILKKGTTDLIAPNGKWESGMHYVYNLKVTKTEIKASASLVNWDKVEAEEDVWF